MVLELAQVSRLPDYDTWYVGPINEVTLGEAHRPLWRHLIDTIPEGDLSAKSILDFGCGRGGFLRLLNTVKPYRRALDVDIARASIAAAKDLAGTAPVEYAVADNLLLWTDCFDMAFSDEVIYLVPEIAAHAAEI